MPYLIYSIEDDEDISHIISATLKKVNYDLESFATAKSFFEVFNKRKPNMILLDLMLPDMYGLDILKKIRADSANEDIQIIILSAKRMTIDKVDGLDLGADDYIEKPFDILELLSRINSKARRLHSSNSLSHLDLSLDLDKFTCTKSGERIELTNMEFEVLKILLKNVGRPISRDEILSKIYGESVALETRSIDMHINALRKKLDDKQGSVIRTVYGHGYKVG